MERQAQYVTVGIRAHRHVRVLAIDGHIKRDAPEQAEETRKTGCASAEVSAQNKDDRDARDRCLMPDNPATTGGIPRTTSARPGTAR